MICDCTQTRAMVALSPNAGGAQENNLYAPRHELQEQEASLS